MIAAGILATPYSRPHICFHIKPGSGGNGTMNFQPLLATWPLTRRPTSPTMIQSRWPMRVGCSHPRDSRCLRCVPKRREDGLTYSVWVDGITSP
jgi:hypothetical protein